MKRLAAEHLHGNGIMGCELVVHSRRVQGKQNPLFSIGSPRREKPFRTARGFSRFARMNALFARQAAFERRGSKNERD